MISEYINLSNVSWNSLSVKKNCLSFLPRGEAIWRYWFLIDWCVHTTFITDKLASDIIMRFFFSPSRQFNAVFAAKDRIKCFSYKDETLKRSLTTFVHYQSQKLFNRPSQASFIFIFVFSIQLTVNKCSL